MNTENLKYENVKCQTCGKDMSEEFNQMTGIIQSNESCENCPKKKITLKIKKSPETLAYEKRHELKLIDDSYGSAVELYTRMSKLYQEGLIEYSKLAGIEKILTLLRRRKQSKMIEDF